MRTLCEYFFYVVAAAGFVTGIILAITGRFAPISLDERSERSGEGRPEGLE